MLFGIRLEVAICKFYAVNKNPSPNLRGQVHMIFISLKLMGHSVSLLIGKNFPACLSSRGKVQITFFQCIQGLCLCKSLKLNAAY